MKSITMQDLHNLCSENGHAVDMIVNFWRLSEVWDDAVDGDKRKSEADVNTAFLWALFGLHENPFYLAHPELRSTMRICAANWFAANRLQRTGDTESLVTAYTLRCSPFDFFVAVVLAASGPKLADEAALYFRGMPSMDRLTDFMAEHTRGSNHGVDI